MVPKTVMPHPGRASRHSSVQFSSVQSLSLFWQFATPWTAACQASLSITNSWSLFRLMSIESVIPSNHLILCCPLLLLPSIFPSIRVFSNESVLCIRSPRHWSFSFSISPSSEYSVLISFRMDWLDLLTVQGTLKSLLQHHTSKVSVLASKRVYYLGWNRSPAQAGCMRQVLGPGALGRPRGIGWRGRWEGWLGWGIHVTPWLIHVNVWQKPLQYCKVISLQLIKINEK